MSSSSHDAGLARRRRVEKRALQVSMAVTIMLAVGAVLLGVLSGSRIVLFDGAFMSIGLILSWASLRAAEAAASGPTRRFPFGRDALAPLVVVLQGLALAGTLVLAVGDAIIVIRSGGSEVSPLVIAIYGLFTGVVGFAVMWWLTKAAPDSDLVQADAAQWRAGSVLSIIMVVGAAGVSLLNLTTYSDLSRFADPILVLVACAVMAMIPVRLIISGVNELLEGAPPAELTAKIDACIEVVREQFDLPEPTIRSGKVGLKLYVDVDFVVPGEGWDIAREDKVRRAVIDQLETLNMDVWSWVSVTTQAELAV